MIGYNKNNDRLRISIWCFLGLILAFLNPVVSLSQKQNEPQLSQTEDQPLIICGPDLVLAQVEIIDENEVAIPSLMLNDFVIFENGILQTILFFKREDDSITRSVKYRIGYYPEKSGRESKSRRIRVEVVGRKGEGLKVKYCEVLFGDKMKWTPNKGMHRSAKREFHNDGQLPRAR